LLRAALSEAERAASARAIRRTAPFAARPGMRLDSDMARAIRKLSQMNELTRGLPGRNCGQCGAPTCAALAEDIVLDRATIAACKHPMRAEARARSSQ
jgi:ArsR family metal-binding transcriptional regulator